MNEVKVLLVDDDPIDAKLLAEHLSRVRKTKYHLVHVTRSGQAFSHLKSQSYDIVITDYYLGDTDGVTLIHRLREINQSIPIIVITGSDSDEIDEQVMTAGAADYLPKEELSSSTIDRTIRHALERARYLSKLEYLANRDPLTGLANRSMFEEELSRAIAISSRHNHQFAVLLLDLDRFKEINDTLGHNVGDLLLTIIGNRLQKLLREEDVIARIGGDEFAILLQQTSGIDDISLICSKILAGLSEPTPINESSLFVSTSIGVAFFPDNGTSSVDLMQKSDLALYKAKVLGRNKYSFFSHDLQERLHYETTIEKALREDIDRNHFELYYQPKYNLNTEKLTGFEALIRWNHPELGFISPADFIPVAEKTGLILELSDWITETACKQLHEWNNLGASDLGMAINMSAKQVRKAAFFEHLRNFLTQYKLNPASIELEVTESLLVDSSIQNINFFRELKAIGIQLTLDDFGTGYSSLSYIKNFPIDKLKIDRSFISGTHANQQQMSIVQAIIQLAHALKMHVVAEGIETQEQAFKLKHMNCDEAQGFWYYKPLPKDKATELVINFIAQENEQTTD